MIDRARRKTFAIILDKFADTSATYEDWSSYIIEHYLDEGLENIRREVVRLRIKAGDPEVFPTNDQHRAQLRHWANELRQS